ncbi:MAG: hypothetical protein GF408_01190 [Candidatus Omnitrophica bacterium]|nr:hypothetical protein [Candidatus Omnitrophota bacterium]
MSSAQDRHFPRTYPPAVINFFFALGLLSAVSFRSLIILNHFNVELVRIAWYFGTCGYIFFFAYRYYIAHKRRKAIRDFKLVEKVRRNPCMDEQDKEVTEYILNSILRSREMFNYLAIFLLSLMAIVTDQALAAMGK